MGLCRRKATIQDEGERCPRCAERVPEGASECAMWGWNSGRSVRLRLARRSSGAHSGEAERLGTRGAGPPPPPMRLHETGVPDAL